MAAPPFHKRPFDAFLSHAHVERTPIVERLYSWLQNGCGFQIWFDAKHLAPGQPIASCLDEMVTQARGMLILLSRASLSSGWVRQELRAAKDQRNRHPGFRIVGIRIDDVEPPEDQRIELWLDAPAGELSPEGALLLIAGLHGEAFRPPHRSRRDVFVSRGWSDADQPVAATALAALSNLGLWAVGDARQQKFDPARIQGIMSTCVGHLCLLPKRAGRTFSEYFDSELRLAASEGLPQLVIADPSSLPHLPEAVAAKAHPFEYDKLAEGERDSLARLTQELNWLAEAQVRARREHCFLATDFSDEARRRNETVKALLEGLTGLPCVTGHDIREGSLQEKIISAISTAYLMVADISEENINTCVEAGMARALGTRLFLAGKGPARRPVFMFRDWQVHYYENELDLLGGVHRAVSPFRRWVMAAG